MSETMFTKKTYVWHDLTVNPMDTPKDDNEYYFVITKNNMDWFCYDPRRNLMARFCGTHWECDYYHDETYDYEYFKSYGLESGDLDFKPDEFASEILAWAELIEEEYGIFIPNLMSSHQKQMKNTN